MSDGRAHRPPPAAAIEPPFPPRVSAAARFAAAARARARRGEKRTSPQRPVSGGVTGRASGQDDGAGGAEPSARGGGAPPRPGPPLRMAPTVPATRSPGGPGTRRAGPGRRPGPEPDIRVSRPTATSESAGGAAAPGRKGCYKATRLRPADPLGPASGDPLVALRASERPEFRVTSPCRRATRNPAPADGDCSVRRTRRQLEWQLPAEIERPRPRWLPRLPSTVTSAGVANSESVTVTPPVTVVRRRRPPAGGRGCESVLQCQHSNQANLKLRLQVQ